MAETYQLLINMHDVRECSQFVAKAIKRRERRGMDAKASFFTVIAALNIALAESMRAVDFEPDEIASILAQASQAGFNAQDIGGVN